jgi:hypothetical protein
MHANSLMTCSAMLATLLLCTEGTVRARPADEIAALPDQVSACRYYDELQRQARASWRTFMKALLKANRAKTLASEGKHRLDRRQATYRRASDVAIWLSVPQRQEVQDVSKALRARFGEDVRCPSDAAAQLAGVP